MCQKVYTVRWKLLEIIMGIYSQRQMHGYMPRLFMFGLRYCRLGINLSPCCFQKVQRLQNSLVVIAFVVSAFPIHNVVNRHVLSRADGTFQVHVSKTRFPYVHNNFNAILKHETPSTGNISSEYQMTYVCSQKGKPEAVHIGGYNLLEWPRIFPSHTNDE